MRTLTGSSLLYEIGKYGFTSSSLGSSLSGFIGAKRDGLCEGWEISGAGFSATSTNEEREIAVVWFVGLSNKFSVD